MRWIKCPAKRKFQWSALYDLPRIQITDWPKYSFEIFICSNFVNNYHFAYGISNVTRKLYEEEMKHSGYQTCSLRIYIWGGWLSFIQNQSRGFLVVTWQHKTALVELFRKLPDVFSLPTFIRNTFHWDKYLARWARDGSKNTGLDCVNWIHVKQNRPVFGSILNIGITYIQVIFLTTWAVARLF